MKLKFNSRKWRRGDFSIDLFSQTSPILFTLRWSLRCLIKLAMWGLRSPKETLISKLVNFKGPLQITMGLRPVMKTLLKSSLTSISYTSKS